MKLLAIDTATQRCSVALYLDGETVERAVDDPRAHADNVLPFVEQLLAGAAMSLAALDGIAFGRGPGGFTGLRVAAAVTQGLALGSDLPVAGISDLAALAHAALQAAGGSSVAAGLDARMGEIYYGIYRSGGQGVEAIVEDRLARPEEVDIHTPGRAVGPGWRAHFDALPPATRDALKISADGPPAAHAVAALGAIEFAAGRGGPAETAVPVYLRDNVAKKPGGLSDVPRSR
jgi:tRNA threonylcarbamoyladenosine biosynthesis protein TsaB